MREVKREVATGGYFLLSRGPDNPLFVVRATRFWLRRLGKGVSILKYVLSGTGGAPLYARSRSVSSHRSLDLSFHANHVWLVRDFHRAHPHDQFPGHRYNRLLLAPRGRPDRSEFMEQDRVQPNRSPGALDQPGPDLRRALSGDMPPMNSWTADVHICPLLVQAGDDFYAALTPPATPSPDPPAPPAPPDNTPPPG